MNLGSIKVTLHSKINAMSNCLWPVMLLIHLGCRLFNVSKLQLICGAQSDRIHLKEFIYFRNCGWLLKSNLMLKILM